MFTPSFLFTNAHDARYRLQTHVKPLIWIESIIERHSHSRVEYMIKCKSQFKRRSTANNVVVEIPVPIDADTPKFKTTLGTAKCVLVCTSACLCSLTQLAFFFRVEISLVSQSSLAIFMSLSLLLCYCCLRPLFSFAHFSCIPQSLSKSLVTHSLACLHSLTSRAPCHSFTCLSSFTHITCPLSLIHLPVFIHSHHVPLVVHTRHSFTC
jgi:hypothetical protein